MGDAGRSGDELQMVSRVSVGRAGRAGMSGDWALMCGTVWSGFKSCCIL